LATVFPQAIGMAATFDDCAVEQAFECVSDEARAKYHHSKNKNGSERYQGLTFWTPNVNIFRDPRWGRGQETYGEDPYLTSQMGFAVVRGLQGTPESKYDKLHACAKHYAVHSGPEWNRHSFEAEKISPRDLWETYLPAFKALVQEGGVKEICVPTTVSKVSHVVVVIVYCTIFSVRNGDLMDLSYPTAVQLVIFILKAITKHTQLKKQLQLQL
jgi:beta-glucosidase